MNPKDIQEMQSGFAAIYARKAELADRFYVHLFQVMPEAEGMFAGDFAKQKEMFASMLTYCLKGVANNQSLLHAGDTLAKTHARFNLGQHETQLATEAMMKAFEEVLGDDFSETQRVVWRQAITRVMHMILVEDTSNT